MQKANLDDPAPSATDQSAETVEAPPSTNLPARIPPPPPQPAPNRSKRSLARPALALLALAAAVIGGAYWWTHRAPELPPGFAMGNGRIEADEIDISTKFAGRIAEMLADEGDMVKVGQVVARMDTRDLEASLAKEEATILQAQKTLDSARADLEQQRSQVKLADQELQRTRALVQRGNASVELRDQRQAALDGATAAYNSIMGRIGQAEHAIEAAKQDAALTRVNIADNTLVAPKDGRIEYRISNIGEVLAAGGKVFTMLDITSVYMDIFLPTMQAGHTVFGAEGRILLDALPGRPIPATVSFVSAQAQFTPKAVETQSERDKLMFRIRVRIAPDLLRAHAAQVRTGLPGVGYVRLDPHAEWPPQLQPKPAP